MTNTTEAQAWIGYTAVDSEGSKIGKIGQIYLDDSTGEPTWVTVSTGMFGTKESFAPIHGATSDGDNLKLTVTKDMVKDAPKIDTDEHMSDDEVDALLTHYQGFLAPGSSSDDRGRSSEPVYGDAGPTDAGRSAVDPTVEPGIERGVEGHDTSGPTTDDAMTRSEERVDFGTETVQTGKARLRKYIVEETVTQTVPVRHEEVRLEREPITDENRGDAVAGQDLSEEEHEVTLHAERPTVAKETVPVERVKLSTETVTGEQQVDETVRKEQIDQVETDGTTAR